MKPRIATVLTRAAVAAAFLLLGGCTSDAATTAITMTDARAFILDFGRQILAAFLL